MDCLDSFDGWRRVEQEEVFIASGFVLDVPGLHYGYSYKVGVMLKGHDTCNCSRSLGMETVEFFHEHPPNLSFPVHWLHSEQGLTHVNDDGKFGWNDYSIGTLVKTQRCSHGYIQKTEKPEASETLL